MELNEQQQAAVDSTAKTIIIIAGPGSGKTRTMVERIQKRIAEGADPRKMAIMTFTNAGADEFRRRLAPHKLGYAGTLHGFCLRLLQEWGHLIGYRRGGVSIAILDEKDREAMLKAARDGLGLAKRITMKAVMAKDPRDDVKLIWDKYAEDLKRNNMVDYDRILTEARRLQFAIMGENVDRGRFTEVYCDEWQDSGAVDWDIVRGILGVESLCIVGDPDQSIYAFRGGQPALLVDAALGWRDADGEAPHVIFLEQNYRSDASICFAATALISHNTQRSRKAILPTTQRAGFIEANAFDSDTAEAHYIFTVLWKLPATDAVAVLARTNAVAAKLRALLAAFGLPLKRPPKTEPPHGWRLALLLVGLACDPANDIYAEKALPLIGMIGAGPVQLRAMTLAAKAAGMSLWHYAGRGLTPGCPMNAPQWLMMNHCPPEAVLAVQDIANTMSGDATMPDLLQAMWATEAFQVDDGGDGVTVSTIHGAKGKEWDVVVVAGCEEGTLPQLKKDTDVEEERRLMFVAMTRARHTLILTSARNRTGDNPWDKREGLEPSRFLAEARP